MYFNNIYLQYLILEKNIYIGHFINFLIKIEYINQDYHFAKSIKRIRSFCMKKDGSILSTVINNILYFLKV